MPNRLWLTLVSLWVWLVFAENPGRQYLFIQNVSDETMWVNFGTAAVADQVSRRVQEIGRKGS